MARQITVDELREMAAEAKDSIWAQAEVNGRDPKIYLHWTAGHYGQYYLNDYHVAIDEDGSIYVDSDLDEVLAHTWRRNSGAVGITLACGAGANTEDLGNEPPTAQQIEVMAQAIAALAEGLELPEISKQFVLSHGEAADNEDGCWCHEEYGPKTTCERWDLEFLQTDESPSFNPWAEDGSRGGDVLRGKANWYHNRNIG